MTTQATRLLRREQVAAATFEFHLERPGNFEFKPGQAIDLVLPEAQGLTADTRRHAFSLVSAPFDDVLTIATRMRGSAFKQVLRAQTAGSPLEIDGPFGSLTLHARASRPALLIAGGIGITPFISMLRQAERNGWPQRLALIYSNRNPAEASFLDELRRLEHQTRNLRLVATMTRANGISPGWDGPIGRIDDELLRKVSAELDGEPICYIAGPPSFVQGMRQATNAAGIDDDDLRSEDFFGY